MEEGLLERFLNAVKPLVAKVLPRLHKLVTVEAATVGEMRAKFSQDMNGMLEYGSLNEFYGGLEGKVGSPNPKVEEMMAEAQRGDSTRMFMPQLRGVDSDWEWKFTTSPDRRRRAVPEKKIRRAQKGWRRPRGDSLVRGEAAEAYELRRVGDSHGGARQQRASQAQGMILVIWEAIGLRRPDFRQVQCRARGINSKVPYLQKQVVVYCCDEASMKQRRGDQLRGSQGTLESLHDDAPRHQQRHRQDVQADVRG